MIINVYCVMIINKPCDLVVVIITKIYYTLHNIWLYPRYKYYK